MANERTAEVRIRGMDCDDEVTQIQRAIAALPGVESVEVFLASEKAIVRFDPASVGLPAIEKAIQSAGCSVASVDAARQGASLGADLTRRLLLLLGAVFGMVLFVVVAGEWLGLFESMTKRVPWPLWLAVVLVGGYPVFRNVFRATLRRQITSHTLMTVGALAAILVGEWAAAAVVVFFMRVGDFVERFTTERTRQAVKELVAHAPQAARVERDGEEQEIPADQVRAGEVVVVRPGEKIPVDGEVVSGRAAVDQATITGESMPVEVGPGSKVFAATLASQGSVRVRTTHVGPDTTFGRIVRMVEEAEANRGEVQRFADRFSGYYLPVVVALAGVTFLVSRNPLATAAVLVVACSCAFAIATPVAMLASIGAGAKRGLLIKGGKYLESLAHADVLLIDKTGTLTLGRPQITDVVTSNGVSEDQVVSLAASAERYSEHPLAEAVRAAATAQSPALSEPEEFEAIPGLGVRAKVNGGTIAVGSRRLALPGSSDSLASLADGLEAQGKTVMFVTRDGEVIGVLAAADTLRPEVPDAINAVRVLGISQIVLLTGDNERTAASLAARLGVQYRAQLLPEDKIGIVKEYQANGRTVVMVGDGVNDAPALAQADVGIAMGATGSDVAMEAAHILLMREDWALVPEVFRIARRTMKVVKLNIGFTAGYNLVGLLLAALGFLPPVLAAAAQSLPDIGILANSSRLLRQR